MTKPGPRQSEPVYPTTPKPDLDKVRALGIEVDGKSTQQVFDELTALLKQTQLSGASSGSAAEETLRPIGLSGVVASRPHVESWALSPDEQRQQFLKEYPEYSENEQVFKTIRETDYAILDKEKTTYLDYTGAMLPPHTLITQHAAALQNTVLGNPHSNNNPSLAATKADVNARHAVLRMMNAPPDEYECVWTHNASNALLTVGSTYPFDKNGAFLCAPDVHNSVLGMFPYAEGKGARTHMFGFDPTGLSFCWDYQDFVAAEKRLRDASSMLGHRLLAIPAQSNTSGIQHPIKDYVKYAHERGWDVIIDTAAYVPTCGFDMAANDFPEFCVLSFYKVFGYPTGIGALVAKKTALAKLERSTFAGGTVRFVLATPNYTPMPFQISSDRAGYFEEGTIPFQQCLAVGFGVQYMETIGFAKIKMHTWCLTQWVIAELISMRWPKSGVKIFVLPGNGSLPQNYRQGGSFSCIVQTPSGSVMPPKLLEDMGREYGIAVRVGCFCNPATVMHSFVYGPLKWQNDLLKSAKDFDFEQFFTPEDRANKITVEQKRASTSPKSKIRGLMKLDMTKYIPQMVSLFKDFGMLRISTGLPTNFEDVQRLVRFLRDDLMGQEDKIEDMCEEWRNRPDPYSVC